MLIRNRGDKHNQSPSGLKFFPMSRIWLAILIKEANKLWVTKHILCCYCCLTLRNPFMSMWQNPLKCCEIISLQLIKINEKKKEILKRGFQVDFSSFCMNNEWYMILMLSSNTVFLPFYFLFLLALDQGLALPTCGPTVVSHTTTDGPIEPAHGQPSVQFSSVPQSCPTLCNPMDCSTPGFPVYHQLLELAQTHVHWVSEWCHPIISSSVIPFTSHLQSFPESGSF